MYWWRHVGATVVVAEGTLDSAGYAKLRVAMVKAAAEVPRAVIVDLDRTGVAHPTALALFPAVASEIAVWPGIPLVIAVANEANHRSLVDYRMRRYLPVHRSIEAAVDGIADPPPRRVARTELPNGAASFPLARGFVTDWCQQWQVAAERAADVLQVAMELVDNTIKHTYGPPTVRVELRRGLLTVAVYDGDPEPVHLIEPGTNPVTGVEHGLSAVVRLSRAWGSTGTQSGGKVVWAVL
ncbi:MAG: ATP-binding protein [Actinophytocola sp.]|uniref:ATP-binding protein n=1 Tax=Actinophytocola sp. TaxID=1872138 RepID=UPI003D6A92C7